MYEIIRITVDYSSEGIEDGSFRQLVTLWQPFSQQFKFGGSLLDVTKRRAKIQKPRMDFFGFGGFPTGLYFVTSQPPVDHHGHFGFSCEKISKQIVDL